MQQSIPVGTLAATLTTTALYLISVRFFGALATREKLLTDRLVTATITWPRPVIVYICDFRCSSSQALAFLQQSLMMISCLFSITSRLQKGVNLTLLHFLLHSSV